MADAYRAPMGTTTTTKGGNLGNIYSAEGVQYLGATDPMAGGISGYKERSAQWNTAYQAGLYNESGQRLLGQSFASPDRGGLSAYWGAATPAPTAAPASSGGCGICGGAHSTASHLASLQQVQQMANYHPNEVVKAPVLPDMTSESGMKAGGAYKTLGDMNKNVFDRKATGLKGLDSGGKRKITSTTPKAKRKKISELIGINFSSLNSKGVNV